MPFRLNPTTGNLDLVSDTSGYVVGPATATDNAIARYDGTTGKLIQNSLATIQDSGAINAQGFISNREVNGTINVGATESWITPSLEMQPGSIIALAPGAQLIIV